MWVVFRAAAVLLFAIFLLNADLFADCLIPFRSRFPSYAYVSQILSLYATSPQAMTSEQMQVLRVCVSGRRYGRTTSSLNVLMEEAIECLWDGQCNAYGLTGA